MRDSIPSDKAPTARINDCRFEGATIEMNGTEKFRCPYCGRCQFIGRLSAGSVVEIRCHRCNGISRHGAL